MVEGGASVCEDTKTKEEITMTHRLKINGMSLISRRDLSHNQKRKKKGRKKKSKGGWRMHKDETSMKILAVTSPGKD